MENGEKGRMPSLDDVMRAVLPEDRSGRQRPGYLAQDVLDSAKAAGERSLADRQQAEPAPAQDEREAVARALASADWPNVSIGNKALIMRAIYLLSSPAQTEQQPVAEVVWPDESGRRGGFRQLGHYGTPRLSAGVQLYAAPIAQTDPWQPSGADYDRAIHDNPDAKAWADLFVDTFPGLKDKHGLMIGWFANAMMAMHDHLARKTAPQPEQSGLASEEWIEHGPSKPCPFHNPYLSKVDIRLRDGTEKFGELACNHTWFWYEHSQAVYDIVAYRPALSAQGGSDE